MGRKRDNRMLTLWRGNASIVAVSGTIAQMVRDRRILARPVETLPMVEYCLEDSREGAWKAVQEAAAHFDKAHKLRHGDYIECTEGREHKWIMAILHETAYEKMKETYGKNPPAFDVRGTDSLLCVQNIWTK